MEVGYLKGLVTEIGVDDPVKGRVKVMLPEYDGIVSDWLPVVQSLTLGARTWAVPRVDTQVIVLPGEGLEDAVVLGAIYSQPDPPSIDDPAIIGMTADDGVEISYDPTASKLKIESPKLIKIVATTIDIEADVILKGDSDITGDIKLKGDSDISGDIKLKGNSDIQGNIKLQGNSDITGNITQTGSLTTTSAIIGGIVFAAHKHPGVMSGPAVTAPPVA